MNTTSIIDSNVNAEALYAESYAKVLPEILAVPEQDVMQVTVDVSSVVAVVLGSLPEILATRGEIVKQLAVFDINNIDKLETYATALSYANACYLTACEPPDALRDLIDEGTQLRALLYADVSALCARGLINADAVNGYSGQLGYKIVATDLQIVTLPLRQNWSGIQGKCATQEAELERAEKVAMHLLRLVGLRAQAPVSAASAADNRGRAFTLFAKTYDQVRYAVAYVRRDHDDAESIAPSLYAGRKHKAATATDVVVTPAQGTQPAPATGTSPVNTAPTGTKPLNVPLPGSNPFMS